MGNGTPEVVVGRKELAQRIAAVRAAKTAKMARPNFDGNDSLTEEELDDVLGKLESCPPSPQTPPRSRGAKPILPCAACHDPVGFVPRGMHRPARVDGKRFGIAGKVCRRCYDQLKAPQQKPRRGKPENAVKRLIKETTRRRKAS